MKTLRRLAFAAAAVCGLFSAQQGLADPTLIRVGHGAAAEDQLWLMAAKPELFPNLGKAYKVEWSRFPATDKRFQAFEAGAIDVATGSANSVVLAASQGLSLKAIASISQESTKAFHTLYMVKSDSGIKTPKDLKGKTIGINGFSSSIHLWALLAIQKAGLDPEKDVTFVPVPFPAQGEALRSGKIDVGAFPQPFAKMEQDKGGLNTLFTSKDGVPFDEELMLLVAKPEFGQKNPEALRAFLSDLVFATKYYTENSKAARKALIDAQFVRLPETVYFDMVDYYREPSGKIDIGSLNKMQDLQIKVGWQAKAADINALVDMKYLPK